MGLSDEEFIKMNIANLNAFRATLKKASEKVSDLSIPLGEVVRDFYKSERAIFQLRGPGGYKDLAESTKKQKARLGFPVYPILKRSGQLERSVTIPGASGSYFKINKLSAVIGSTISYGAFHNSDLARKKIPQRKFLFIGPESREFAGNQELGGRPIRWRNIIEYYVKSVMGEL